MRAICGIGEKGSYWLVMLIWALLIRRQMWRAALGKWGISLMQRTWLLSHVVVQMTIFKVSAHGCLL